MENLHRGNKINQRDISAVYEALFLRSVTSFESFLEELFIDILMGKAAYDRKRVKPILSIRYRKDLIRILLQNERYMNWLPYNYTVDRAKIYLDEGRPFSDLSDGDRSLIKTISLIRNAIAHKSDHALDEFKNKVISSQTLLPAERSPSGFLRTRMRSGTTQNRFQVYTAALGRIASSLC